MGPQQRVIEVIHQQRAMLISTCWYSEVSVLRAHEFGSEVMDVGGEITGEPQIGGVDGELVTMVIKRR